MNQFSIALCACDGVTVFISVWDSSWKNQVNVFSVLLSVESDHTWSASWDHSNIILVDQKERGCKYIRKSLISPQTTVSSQSNPEAYCEFSVAWDGMPAAVGPVGLWDEAEVMGCGYDEVTLAVVKEQIRWLWVSQGVEKGRLWGGVRPKPPRTWLGHWLVTSEKWRGKNKDMSRWCYIACCMSVSVTAAMWLSVSLLTY